MRRFSLTSRAVVLYCACTLLLAYPLVLDLRSSAMPGDPDTDLFMWTLAWNTHAITEAPLSIFDANIYHPHERTLAFSENLLGSTIFAAPILWTTGDMLLALNATALLSIVLSGAGAFLLARRVGLGGGAALICGMIFAFSPARFFRLGQLHLTTIQWIPFCLAYLHAYLDGGRRRDLRLAIAFFSLQALSSGHGAVFLSVGVLLLLAWSVATGTALQPVKRLRDVGLPGVLVLIPALLVFLPYRQVQKELGLVRTLADWETPYESFLASVTPVHSWVLSHLSDTNFVERANAFLFPGFVVLALAAVALVAGLRQLATGRDAGHEPSAARAVAFYGFVAVVSVLLSAGPPLGMWPYVHELPGLNFIRVPSRFMLLGTLALAVLGGFGFQALAARRSPKTRAALATVAVLMILAECFTIPLPAHRPYAVTIPAADRWLVTQSPDAVIAEAPATEWNDRLQSTYMLHSTAHWRKTVQGHSGFRTPLHVDLYTKMRRFPDDESLRTLAAAGVTHVVVHPEFYGEDAWPRVRDALELATGLQLAFDDGESRVYRLAIDEGR